MDRTQNELAEALYGVSARAAETANEQTLLERIGLPRMLQSVIVDLFIDGPNPAHDPKHLEVIRYQIEQLHRGGGVDFSGERRDPLR